MQARRLPRYNLYIQSETTLIFATSPNIDCTNHALLLSPSGYNSNFVADDHSDLSAVDWCVSISVFSVTANTKRQLGAIFASVANAASDGSSHK